MLYCAVTGIGGGSYPGLLDRRGRSSGATPEGSGATLLPEGHAQEAHEARLASPALPALAGGVSTAPSRRFNGAILWGCEHCGRTLAMEGPQKGEEGH